MSFRAKLYLALAVLALFLTTVTTAIYYLVSFVLGEELNQRAYAQLSAANWDEAITLYDSASQKKLPATTLALVYGNRGWCYTKKDMDGQAIRDFSKSIELDPSPVYSVLNRGLAYHRTGEFEKAVVDYGTALSKDPNVTDAYHNRGLIFGDRGEWPLAIADFSEAIRCDPYNAQFFVYRGMAYAADNQLDPAIANFDSALKFNPTHAGAYIQRAAAYSRKGDPAKGLADVSAAIEEMAGARQLRYARAYIYLDRGVIDKAVEDCEEALRIEPNYDLAYLLRARAAMHERNWPAVLRDADTALELTPKLSWAHYLRGRAFTGQGRFDEAIAEFNRTLQIDPGSVWAWYYRAQNHAYRQEYSLALRQLREAVERFPKAEAPHLGLAWFLATCPHDAYRDGKEAVAEATKGCEITHWGNWYAADVLGAAYAELGDFDQAIKYANLALSLPGASPRERAVVEQRLSRYNYRIPNRDVGGAEITPSFFEEAVSAYTHNDYDRAISCLNAVLPPNPGNSTAAMFHIFDGTHDRRSRAPWSPEESSAMTNGFYYRGLSYQAKREWDKAIADFTTAIWREPGSMLALAGRGISYRQKGQMDWAFRDFDEMIRRKPEDALGYALRADALHWTKEWDAALEVADTAMRLDPKLALSYEVRGRVYASKQEYEKADRNFGEAERVEPERVEKILTRAYTFKRQANYTLAEIEFRETAERFPRSAYAHNALAWFLATCPDTARRNGIDAIVYAKSACELTKWHDADYLDTLAAAYAETGDFEQAVKYVREAIAKMEAKSESRNEIEGHLALFQRKEACRDTR